MNYDDIRKLSQPEEPSNDELRDIEDHLDDYFEDQAQPIIILIIIKISNTSMAKFASKSD